MFSEAGPRWKKESHECSQKSFIFSEIAHSCQSDLFSISQHAVSSTLSLNFPLGLQFMKNASSDFTQIHVSLRYYGREPEEPIMNVSICKEFEDFCARQEVFHSCT